MSNRLPPIVGLEIGTSQTTALVGEVDDADRVNIVGRGTWKTYGMRKGQIFEMRGVMEAIDSAIEKASSTSDVSIASVFLAFGGEVSTTPHQGHASIDSENNVITRDDILYVHNMAADDSDIAKDEQKLLHVVHQGYMIDAQGVRSPEGMKGRTLHHDVLLLYAPRVALDNLGQAVKTCSAQLDIDDTVFSPIAASYSTLTADQKANGVVLIDLGAGTTKYLAFVNGITSSVGSIAVGGDHVTADIAAAFSLARPFAEELKKEHACAVIGKDVGLRRIQLPNDPLRQDSSISLKSFHTVVNARMEETLRLVRRRLEADDVLGHLGAGVVFTGGGAAMPGLLDLARIVFGNVPCAIGSPQMTVSWRPLRISRAPSPMAWEPLAQAPEMVRLMPFRRKMTLRFIDTVEFIDWKMAPEPQSIVSFFWRMVLTDL